MERTHYGDGPWRYGVTMGGGFPIKAASTPPRQPAGTPDAWRCGRCGSPGWVGWRAGPAHRGFLQYAQCVPCGHVQDLPDLAKRAHRLYVTRFGLAAVVVNGPDGATWRATAPGIYDLTTWPPALIEETSMDSVSAAEHFNQEAISRAVQLAEDIKHAELRAARDRFAHHPPTSPQVIRAHERARENGSAFATWLLQYVPPCPERERALDAMDDAVKHANAAIARTQLAGAWFTEEPATKDNP